MRPGEDVSLKGHTSLLCSRDKARNEKLATKLCCFGLRMINEEQGGTLTLSTISSWILRA